MSKEPKTYSFAKFTDSYIMHHRKIPKFLFLIILFISATLIGLITWSAFVTKPYVVKAQSVITVRDKTHINASSNGNIKALNIYEGKKVTVGEVLIELQTTDLDLQLTQIDTTISNYELRKGYYDRLIDYIQNDYNLDEPGHSFDQTNIDELEFYNYMSTYELAKQQVSTNTGLQVNSAKTETLNIRLQERTALVTELEKLYVQKQASTLAKEDYVIRANNNGVVHLNETLSEGLFIQVGVDIGTIANEEDEIIAECYLTAADRAQISIGDKTELALLGLPQSEYGVIKGEVVAIDNDSMTTQGGNYFRAEVKLDTKELHSDSDSVPLTFGLQAETRIVYYQTTYLKYFLEQIGIKIR